MQSWQKLTKSIVLLVWSLILTSMTVVLGAAPLKGLHYHVGKLAYWGLGLALASGLFLAGWPVLAGTLAVLVVVVGIFSDLEEAGHSYLSAGAFSLIITCLFGAGAFAFWVSEAGSGWFSQVVAFIEPPLQEAMRLTQGIDLKVETLVIQAPSIAVILLMVALYVALLSERRMLKWLGVKDQPKRQLSNFRLPDFVVWVFIVSMLGAFAKYDVHWLQVVSVNTFHVCLLMFFFQGLAVLAKTFRLMRIGPVWQVLWFTVLILQLFLVVSLIGLTDYWLDIRGRLVKKVAQMKKENV